MATDEGTFEGLQNYVHLLFYVSLTTVAAPTFSYRVQSTRITFFNKSFSNLFWYQFPCVNDMFLKKQKQRTLLGGFSVASTRHNGCQMLLGTYRCSLLIVTNLPVLCWLRTWHSIWWTGWNREIWVCVALVLSCVAQEGHSGSVSCPAPHLLCLQVLQREKCVLPMWGIVIICELHSLPHYYWLIQCFVYNIYFLANCTK